MCLLRGTRKAHGASGHQLTFDGLWYLSTGIGCVCSGIGGIHLLNLFGYSTNTGVWLMIIGRCANSSCALALRRRASISSFLACASRSAASRAANSDFHVFKRSSFSAIFSGGTFPYFQNLADYWPWSGMAMIDKPFFGEFGI